MRKREVIAHDGAGQEICANTSGYAVHMLPGFMLMS
jgi:hypothetical protein